MSFNVRHGANIEEEQNLMEIYRIIKENKPDLVALQAAYINQMLGESVQPVLLGMDMGARPNEQPYFSFRKKWQDAGQGSWLQTWNEGIPGDRHDYIFVLLKNKVRVKNYRAVRKYPTVSDHYPILATIEFW